jgi:hypothetical protein
MTTDRRRRSQRANAHEARPAPFSRPRDPTFPANASSFRRSEPCPSEPEGSIKGSIPTARWRSCKFWRNEKPCSAGLLQSPLTDSNRRPPLYEEGPCVNWRLVHRPVMADAVAVQVGEQCSSLYRLLVGGQGRLEFAPVAHLLKDRQAARGSVAPLGAKGSPRLSMCQIASDSRRARSIWARGVQKPDPHAAAASSYSWMRPPSRSRRIT